MKLGKGYDFFQINKFDYYTCRRRFLRLFSYGYIILLISDKKIHIIRWYSHKIYIGRDLIF